MDLFFLYPDDGGGNGSWVGGMVSWKREKLRYCALANKTHTHTYRWAYSRELQPWNRDNDVCTADLGGELFMVACDIESFLEDDYGKNWTIPFHDKNFVWLVNKHFICAQS
jgi:hypothetical protein